MVKKHTFQPVSAKVNFPELEERILKFWKENQIFEKSIAARPASKTWTFLDGPPFITGLPHYGSLLSSIPKDLFPRYWTMKGYRVRRVWGWDCHGLPAENKVEDKLGITRKKDIEEKVGIKKFIEECKLYVSDVSGEWKWYVDHIGRWVDFAHAYKTMDMPYMETVMWVFKSLYDKGYIYKGLRVSLYCPHCATPISNFEVAMDADNYRSVTDPGTIYKYPLQDVKDTYILAWSTTPWNKLVTPALAVNPKLIYVKVAQADEYYILAKSRVKMLNKEPFKVVDEFLGQELVGKAFQPHYDFYKVDPGKKAFIIVNGEFVTAEEGTGVVTIAAYGEEDLAVMQRESIQIVMHLDDEGILKPFVPKWGGMYYLKANIEINKDLAARGLIYDDKPYSHTVPTCWRCHTRLIFAPQDAWYVNVQSLKKRMKETNEAVNWFPKHFKYGRYLKSLEFAPDWCISRSRYWGSPVPVWECECGERFVPGSISELEILSGKHIADLHKPAIDQVTIKCPKCNQQAKRVPEVLDSWIEAGSAPFAERHFPFEKDLRLTDFFPPDFIVEYTGQIRAWFYVLHVLATALFESHAFKNVVVTGVILGTDGRKMSKNYGNYPDPKELLQKYGGDALRLYLMGSPVMHGEDIIISENEYRNQVKGMLLILWNVYNFFVTNALVDGWSAKNTPPKPVHVLDKWILSRLYEHIETMAEKGYEKYDSVFVVQSAEKFIRELSLWYVRRSRNRFGPGSPNSIDKERAYHTLWFVLKEYVKSISPLIPFVTESMYRNLTGEISVHLADWPTLPSEWRSVILEKDMTNAIKLASRVHAFRKQTGVIVRIPIKTLEYTGPDEISGHVREILLEEINVYDLVYKGTSSDYTVSGKTDEINLDIQAGYVRKIIRQVQNLRKEKKLNLSQPIKLQLDARDKGKITSNLLEKIKQKTLASEIVWGDGLSISTG